MNRAIVVFNAGSTSLKFAAYAVDAGGVLSMLCVGRIERMPPASRGTRMNGARAMRSTTGPRCPSSSPGSKPTLSIRRLSRPATGWYSAERGSMRRSVSKAMYWTISTRWPRWSRRTSLSTCVARRVIVAHLGGGASMCAMLDGKSVETTMGFAGVSGLPMATRSGDVPQGALFYLLRRKLFDDATLEKMLYERSGLLGLSGISGDMRVLQESTDPRAVAAVECFVYAMTKYAGAYATVLGGLDAFVFTAGIGENSVPLRAALCGKLTWLGVKLDIKANTAGGPRISTPDSRVSVWVIPTNEELMIAQHTRALI
jgi:acetate kinase